MNGAAYCLATVITVAVVTTGFIVGFASGACYMENKHLTAELKLNETKEEE